MEEPKSVVPPADEVTPPTDPDQASPEVRLGKINRVFEMITQDMRAHPDVDKGGFKTECPICGTKLIVVWQRQRKGNSRGRTRQKQAFGGYCQTPGCVSFRGH